FVAPDAPTGLQLAARCKPDVAMIDISMPGMTGWQMAHELRAMPDATRLKIVVVSANAHEYVPGAEGGRLHDAFIMKPVDMNQLLDRLGELLGLTWDYEAEPPPPAPESTVARFSDHHNPDRYGRHLDDLYQLGRIGHVRGIHAKLAEMAAEHPSNEALANQLRTLVGNFELKRYMNVLEAMRNNG
ncbi:MAG TPA: response regulator, partial [Steroidobacteraceae bacterium]|nr:response regulator [Steroidobacteraceae bacterium]